jgi:hypothetical protein
MSHARKEWADENPSSKRERCGSSKFPSQLIPLQLESSAMTPMFEKRISSPTRMWKFELRANNTVQPVTLIFSVSVTLVSGWTTSFQFPPGAGSTLNMAFGTQITWAVKRRVRDHFHCGFLDVKRLFQDAFGRSSEAD